MNNDNEFQEKLQFYIEAFEKARQKVGDDNAAAALIQEAAKDRRTNQMQRDRKVSGGEAATAKQVDYLVKLGAKVPAGITKLEASELIDELLAR
jgi:hypothetical protein